MEHCDNIKPRRKTHRKLNRLGVEIMNGSIVSFYWSHFSPSGLYRQACGEQALMLIDRLLHD